MTKQVRAFAPGNISCFFKLVDHEDPRWRGSVGLGFTIDEGVTVTVQKTRKTAIFFNEKQIVFPTVLDTIASLINEPVHVSIMSSLPLGFGFGLSGASALATAYAVNMLLDLQKSDKELAIVAHTADANNRTGLGDVVNQLYGGMFVKFVSSAKFTVTRIPMSGIQVYLTCFGPLSTKAILSDTKRLETINTAADVALAKVKKQLGEGGEGKVSFADIIALSKEYVKESGLLQDRQTRDTIAAIEQRGGHASMVILGNAVYSDMPFEGARRFVISDQKAHILSF